MAAPARQFWITSWLPGVLATVLGVCAASRLSEELRGEPGYFSGRPWGHVLDAI